MGNHVAIIVLFFYFFLTYLFTVWAFLICKNVHIIFKLHYKNIKIFLKVSFWLLNDFDEFK